jgi:hypothetical protein
MVYVTKMRQFINTDVLKLPEYTLRAPVCVSMRLVINKIMKAAHVTFNPAKYKTGTKRNLQLTFFTNKQLLKFKKKMRSGTEIGALVVAARLISFATLAIILLLWAGISIIFILVFYLPGIIVGVLLSRAVSLKRPAFVIPAIVYLVSILCYTFFHTRKEHFLCRFWTLL